MLAFNLRTNGEKTERLRELQAELAKEELRLKNLRDTKQRNIETNRVNYDSKKMSSDIPIDWGTIDKEKLDEAIGSACKEIEKNIILGSQGASTSFRYGLFRAGLDIYGWVHLISKTVDMVTLPLPPPNILYYIIDSIAYYFIERGITVDAHYKDENDGYTVYQFLW